MAASTAAVLAQNSRSLESSLPYPFSLKRALDTHIFASSASGLSHCADYSDFHNLNDALPITGDPEALMSTTDFLYSSTSIDPWLEQCQSSLLFDEEGISPYPDMMFEQCDSDENIVYTPSNVDCDTLLGKISGRPEVSFNSFDIGNGNLSSTYTSAACNQHAAHISYNDTQQCNAWTTPRLPQSSAASTTSTDANDLYVDQWLPEDLHEIGFQDPSGNWRCKHSACISSKIFVRACDLRKHYRSHIKMFFCEEPDCIWSTIGFSSKKDSQRHRRSHNPQISCAEVGCERKFGRIDNMKAHYRRVHCSARNNAFPRRCRKSSRKDTA